MPKWVNSSRQSYLVKLWLTYGNKCLLGHSLCPIPEHYIYRKGKQPTIMRLYDLKEAEAVKAFVVEDRELAIIDWQEQKRALHRLADRTYPVAGIFNAVSRDIFHDQQPLYYLEGYGLSGITLKPFVKVKLASSYMRLHINLGDTLKRLSKNKRRKIVRYEKGGLPLAIQGKVDRLVREAVRDYRK